MTNSEIRLDVLGMNIEEVFSTYSKGDMINCYADLYSNKNNEVHELSLLEEMEALNIDDDVFKKLDRYSEIGWD